ncbi:hypothetical protein J23TS9_13640 [Paenibacillus sp. J23TS9]|uniref:hypothetical protein n=1 Tax=Paenibacillus sp. J23TS9 TaxID=2807193 RepID=UPI001B2EB8E5|nr:hypothetical protein [Paenibacillus sp. J23TS9]GIP26234.1 hypothetical protein J23TS9_13640 [Paenibacillus sp. J23TS9]
MNITILGCNTIGLVYVSNLEGMPGIRVAGIFNLNEERVSKVGKLCQASIYTT